MPTHERGLHGPLGGGGPKPRCQQTVLLHCQAASVADTAVDGRGCRRRLLVHISDVGVDGIDGSLATKRKRSKGATMPMLWRAGSPEPRCLLRTGIHKGLLRLWRDYSVITRPSSPAPTSPYPS